MCILSDDILSQILISLLTSLENEELVKFALDVKNCSFLDDTWQLPLVRKYEFVPCERLGVIFKGSSLPVESVFSEMRPPAEVEQRIVVTEVELGSIADEEVTFALRELMRRRVADCNTMKELVWNFSVRHSRAKRR